MRRAMSKYFRTADNVLLHYYDLGAGRTLIVVSGWTIAAEVWLKHTELLARMFRLVLLDSRSQGYSEQSRPTNWLARQAADLGELLAHLRREYVVLLGWSMGASQILQYVSQFGTSGISALVFVDTFFVQPKWMKKEVERLITELREDRVRSTERYVRNMYKTPVSAEYLNAIVTGCLRTPTEVAVGLLEGFLQQTDWRPALAKIDRPVCMSRSRHLRVRRNYLGKMSRASKWKYLLHLAMLSLPKSRTALTRSSRASSTDGVSTSRNLIFRNVSVGCRDSRI